ncbi:hypothetical protein VTK73DRAFT_904 [Phialemonium thermophilum]|uniref:Dolichol-phosphate mannosyltransferase n=1 Tax=Phialemonium thermophilum TaxID=223376 RepID=A0ABR3Y427_9PEZI
MTTPLASTPFPVLVHPYPSLTENVCAYEILPHSSGLSAPTEAHGRSQAARNALVFIGGLSDGPHTVPYIRTIAARIAEAGTALSCSVFETRLRSSFAGFGFGSLAEDVEDIDALVRYLRGIGKQRIVLMGHSTGSQDCMEYSNYEKYRNAPVDGFILQGPVSDRQALAKEMDATKIQQGLAFAAKLVEEGRGDQIMPRDLLPRSFTTPITAYRWHSLLSIGGDDDYFSSDLPDEALAASWGRLQQPVLVVPSGSEEYAPEGVDMARLVQRWATFCRPGVMSSLSGLIPGANHRVDPQESQDWLADRVVRFLQGIQGVEEGK